MQAQESVQLPTSAFDDVRLVSVGSAEKAVSRQMSQRVFSPSRSLPDICQVFTVGIEWPLLYKRRPLPFQHGWPTDSLFAEFADIE